MTTLTLDPTGAASANLIQNETQAVDTTQTGGIPMLLFVAQGLFFSTGVVINYAGNDGSSKTLTLGDDYSFLLEIDGVAGGSIYGGIKINNLTLNGVLTFKYQALGGQWLLDPVAIKRFIDTNYYNSRVAYLSLTPAIPIYLDGSTSPLILNNISAIQAAQTQGPLPLALTGLVQMLPNSKRRYIEAGLVMDGNGTILN